MARGQGLGLSLDGERGTAVCVCLGLHGTGPGEVGSAGTGECVTGLWTVSVVFLGSWARADVSEKWSLWGCRLAHGGCLRVLAGAEYELLFLAVLPCNHLERVLVGACCRTCRHLPETNPRTVPRSLQTGAPDSPPSRRAFSHLTLFWNGVQSQEF